MPFSPEALAEKTYNRCIPCPMRPNLCSGPNPLKLEQPRLGEWISLLIKQEGFTYAEVAEAALVTEMTIYRFVHGANLNFDTVQRIINFVWPDPEGGRPLPCPLADQQKIEAITTENEKLCAEVAQLKKQLESIDLITNGSNDSLHKFYQTELQIIRDEAKAKIDHLLLQINDLRLENERKARLIDRLMDK